MEELQVDVVIIGSGPAGQKAAIQAAKLGKKVVVVEKDGKPGGACLYSGTIPSKTLREAIVDLTGFHQRVIYGKDFPMKEVTINDLNFRLNSVIEEQGKIITRQFRKNDIRFIIGSARFENKNMVIVTGEDGRLCYQIYADKFIIATGSKPRNPPDLEFDDHVILDSTRLLSIDKVPQSMLVLGGGIIGSEYASFFSALGTEVTVIDKKDHMLPLLDHEIGIHLQTALTNLGLRFKGKKIPAEIKRVNDRAHVRFEDGTSLEADTLLFALGRLANIENLSIENAGLAISPRGYIPVNALFQTKVSHIYAVGDVVGGPCLASTSMEQGRLAARHACGIETHHFPTFYPVGIYTIPTISCCGYTEQDLIDMGFHYEVGRAYYYEIARSHIAGSNVGMFKILFHSETLELLGVHVIGRGATEVIHIGQLAMGFKAHVDYFIDQVFNYPTYAEGYRIAALNGINKIKRRR
ncbi:MAG: putative soluble pyridine nucleotide transhydrogenase [Chlamydiae bacterium]|nr:putative soluble pyridine nucleotide transhydrogenase [Chlamydiota bacterium]